MKDIVPFFPVSADEVPSKAWPFVVNLNEMQRRWTFYRRNLRLVQCIDPRTGGISIRFSELVSNVEFEATDEGSCAIATLQRFEHDYLYHFGRYLSDALGSVAPEAYLNRVKVFGELMEEAGEPWDPELLPIQEGHTSVSAYLFAANAAHTTLINWDHELRQVADGTWLTLWKAGSQRRGASEGGRKSAVTRRKQSLAPPEEVLKLYTALRLQGHPESSLASKIASRLRVTPDHIRRLLRANQRPT